MMKVLVIFDLVPEEQKRAIVTMSNEEYEFFRKAHNVYINASDDIEGMVVANVIYNAFCDNEDYRQYCETEMDKKYFGKWKSNLDEQDIDEVNKLIVCGFIL